MKRYTSASLAEKKGEEFVKAFNAIMEGKATYMTTTRKVLEFKNGQIKSKKQV